MATRQSTMSSAELREIGRSITDHGYAILPGLYDEDAVAAMRAAVEQVHAEAGSPVPYLDGHEWVLEGVERSISGFVIIGLLAHAPQLQSLVMRPELVEVVRGALGEGAYAELIAGHLTDHHRPFFRWHSHVGGQDNTGKGYELVTGPSRFDRVERLAALIYLTEIGPASGQLLLYPRHVRDSYDPPHDLDATRWEGQVAVTGPPGTVVLMEQATYHAVSPSQRATPRSFVGLTFAGAHSTPTAAFDASLYRLDDPHPSLRAMLPPRFAHRNP